MCIHRINGHNYSYRHVRCGSKVLSIYMGAVGLGGNSHFSESGTAEEGLGKGEARVHEKPIEIDKLVLKQLREAKPKERKRLFNEVEDATIVDRSSFQKKKYVTNYLGSKQKLTDKIIQMTPHDAKTIVDGFGGSNVVGYEFKKLGKKVISNDKLHYSHHIARAIIENNKEKLSDKDINMLFTEDKHHPNFVRNTFKDVYFTPEILNEIDSIRFNINKLKGYKKDIALFALGRHLFKVHAFGNFQVSKHAPCFKDEKDGRTFGGKNLNAFKDKYKKTIYEVNNLVFDNGKKNKAFREDVDKVVKRHIRKKARKDKTLAYFDPPYVTQFSNTNYEKHTHFVEGLMTYWKDSRHKKINQKSKTKEYEIENTLDKENVRIFFEKFLDTNADYSILSYRDKAYPTEKEIKKIIKKGGDKIIKKKRISHKYQISAKKGEASNAKELMYLVEND
jgi:adenine-specific DNA-methyltransferase